VSLIFNEINGLDPDSWSFMECPSQIRNSWAIIEKPTSLTCPFGNFAIKIFYEEQVELISEENNSFYNNNTLSIDIEQNGILIIYHYKKEDNDEVNYSIKIIYNCFEIGYWFRPGPYEEIFSKNCLIKLQSESIEGKLNI
jgi:hypothetical protein